jgi:hypothetical protein
LRVFSIGARNRAINPSTLSFYRVPFPASIGAGEVGFGFGGDMMRHAGIALVSSFVIAIAIGHPSIAEAQKAAATGDCFMWIDAKTGDPVPRGNLYPPGNRNPADPNHISIPSSSAGPGRDFVRVGGSWIDAKTGDPVPSANLYPPGNRSPADPNHISIPSSSAGPGRDFVRVPCPPPVEHATGTPVMPPAVGTGEAHKTDTGSRDGNPADDKKTATTSANPDTPAKTDTPSTAPAASKTIEKQDAAVDRKTVTSDEPKRSTIRTEKPAGEKTTSAKTAKTKSASRTASKKTKKEEDKVQMHIEFYSTKSGGGGGGFNGGGYGR